MKKKHIPLLITTICLLVLYGCVPRQITSEYKTEVSIHLSGNEHSSQTIGFVTIDICKLPENYYKDTSIKKRLDIKVIPAIKTALPKNRSDDYCIASEMVEFPFFMGLTPLKITIHNQNRHIIRLADSRIIYIKYNSETAIKSLNKSELIKKLSQLPIYQEKLKELSEKQPFAKPGNIEEQIKIALLDIIANFDISDNFEIEVMPGMESNSIIVFPMTPDKFSSGVISFIDIVSETDVAGNPLKKVRFDFELSSSNKYFKTIAARKSKNDKIWNQITEEEYFDGLEKPEKFFYDRSQKSYISDNQMHK